MSNSLPAAQKLHQRFKGDGRVRVVAVATAFEKDRYPFMADEPKIRQALQQNKWDFPVMRDKDEATVKTVGLGNSYGTPMTLVVDAAGTVHWHGFNNTPETAAAVERAVDDLLASFWVPSIAGLSGKLESYARGQYARAWNEAEALQKRSETAAELVAQAEEVKKNIEAGIARWSALSADKRAAGYPGAARERLEAAAKTFKGVPAAKDLDEALKTLRGDAAFAKELTAEKDLDKLMVAAGNPDAKRKALVTEVERLAKVHAATQVINRIQALAERLATEK